MSGRSSSLHSSRTAASAAPVARSVNSIRCSSGNSRYGAGTGSRSSTRVCLPIASRARASATDDPTASPSGRAWEVRMNDLRSRRTAATSAALLIAILRSIVVCRQTVVLLDRVVDRVFFAPRLALFLQLEKNGLDPLLVLGAGVELETEFGNAAQPDQAGQLPAHERRRALEGLDGGLLRLVVADLRVVNADELKVGRNLDARERDEADAWIADVA